MRVLVFLPWLAGTGNLSVSASRVELFPSGMLRWVTGIREVTCEGSGVTIVHSPHSFRWEHQFVRLDGTQLTCFVMGLGKRGSVTSAIKASGFPIVSERTARSIAYHLSPVSPPMGSRAALPLGVFIVSLIALAVGRSHSFVTAIGTIGAALSTIAAAWPVGRVRVPHLYLALVSSARVVNSTLLVVGIAAAVGILLENWVLVIVALSAPLLWLLTAYAAHRSHTSDALE